MVRAWKGTHPSILTATTMVETQITAIKLHEIRENKKPTKSEHFAFAPEERLKHLRTSTTSMGAGSHTNPNRCIRHGSVAARYRPVGGTASSDTIFPPTMSKKVQEIPSPPFMQVTYYRASRLLAVAPVHTKEVLKYARILNMEVQVSEPHHP